MTEMQKQTVYSSKNLLGYKLVGNCELTNRVTTVKHGNKGVLMTKIDEQNVYFKVIRRDGFAVVYNYPRQIFSMFHMSFCKEVFSDEEIAEMTVGSVRANQDSTW